ncbi:DUF4376 domain-containing protein [Salmonella enterica]|uniref:DUF4376 domain-containing protein n=1 Tax=Salmonella enterica I TaxID=59201 RepID=A0A3R1AIJ9_SALET|nr:DUF4376 domain-containing protein [Salmonella enterica subsp. enterica serovar Dahomey]EAW9077954.1 DUF4376 domain-containing protein [Salmonella enterica]EBQ9005154.1 DUF4376 domain-containing protein [Salmonella enterica subsp. enterica serovar Blockley]MML56571.1 DUF4376 domain-containing protein [Salmonella enterica subsp. enterica serovar Kidderminster]ECW2124378.1 DUF4376 domain-containing protein [Salmonella enterica]
MMYAKVINNTVIEWPVTETQIINRGESPDSYTAITDAPRPQCDEEMQYVREAPPKIIDGVLTRQFDVRTKPRNEIVNILTGKLADIRYQREVSGIELDGMKILTDRGSQAQLSGAYQSLASGLITQTDWKAADGWMTVTKEQIEPVARAVAAHVARCFSAEKAVSEKIQNVASPESIDVTGEFEKAMQD